MNRREAHGRFGDPAPAFTVYRTAADAESQNGDAESQTRDMVSAGARPAGTCCIVKPFRRPNAALN
jgi:hypothetical protein